MQHPALSDFQQEKTTGPENYYSVSEIFTLFLSLTLILGFTSLWSPFDMLYIFEVCGSGLKKIKNVK